MAARLRLRKVIAYKEKSRASIIARYFEVVLSGNVSSLTQIVQEEKIDVNTVDSTGVHTAIQLAAHNGDLIMVKYLVEDCDADMHFTTETAPQAIISAVRYGHVDVARFLYKAANAAGSTELLFLDDKVVLLAIGLGHTDVVKFLVDECGLDITGSINGDTALSLAVRANVHTLVLYILTFVKAAQEPISACVLIESMRRNTYSITSTLVEAAQVLGVVDNLDHHDGGGGGRVLVVAAEYGLDKICEALLDMKADVNSGLDSRSALEMAVTNSRTVAVELLITRGADYTVLNSAGTVLHVAAKAGNLEMVRTLIKTGAILVDTPDGVGVPVLMYAVINENDKMMKFLLESKADVDFFHCDTGVSALINGVARFDHDTIMCMMEHTNNHDKALHCALVRGDTRILKSVASHSRVNIDAYYNGYTALMYAAYTGVLAHAVVLVELGAGVLKRSICDRDPAGCGFADMTALMIAAGNDHCNIVQYLLSPETPDPDAMATMPNGMNALSYALSRNAANSSEVLWEFTSKSTKSKYIRNSNRFTPVKTMRRCANTNCENRGKYACGRCKETRYCSKDCQREHWRHNHWHKCNALVVQKCDEVD
jgi:ankyrin repeat protein